MKIEVKNTKWKRGHDSEACFSCKLMVNGAHVANLEQDGWGGPMREDWVDTEAKALVYSHINALPLLQFNGMEMPTNLEIIAYDLIKGGE